MEAPSADHQGSPSAAALRPDFEGGVPFATTAGGGGVTTATVSVMFTDMVGSTALMSRVGPDVAGEVRRTHFELLRGAVASFGGTEVKSEGDALMVVFASASDALGCGVAMHQRVERHNRRAAEPVGLRVAIALGETNVEDGDYFGPCVVEAARLVAVTVTGQLLVSGLVALMMSGRLGFEFGPPIAVEAKGFPEPIEARSVTWAPDAPGSTIPLPSAVLPLEDGLAMVGRDVALGQLEDLWKRAVSGSRQVAFISGEPGIGKTRLAAEMARVASESGGTVLFGRCDEDVGPAYQPFAEALGHYVGRCPLDVLNVHRSAFGDAVNAIVPEFGRRLGHVQRVDGSDPQSERRVLFDALTALLTAAAEDAPVLLILDDLHWASKPTLLLLRQLLRGDAACALLIIGTYRDTDLDRSHALAAFLADMRRAGSAARLALGGLDEAGVVALVSEASGHSLDEAGLGLAGALFAETEGNPFFVGEVLRHLADTGAMQRRDGRWVSDATAIRDLGIPEGIREVVGRRLARLSDDANTFLSVAAVVGSEFELAVVGVVSDLTGDRLLDAVDEALAARLVLEVPGAVGRCRFGHALVRQTVYAEGSSARRAHVHRRVGEAIAALHASDVDPQLAVLAYHFAEGARAGDAVAAAEWALRAGADALTRTAFEEAEAILRRALSVLDFDIADSDERRFELLMALADAQMQMIDVTFRDTALEAAAVARRMQSPERLAFSAAMVSRRFARVGRGDPVVEALCEEALLALGDRDDALRSRLLAGLAGTSDKGGAGWDKVLPLMRAAITAAQRSGDAVAIGWAMWSLNGALQGIANIEDRREAAENYVEFSRRHGAEMRAFAQEQRAGVRIAMGDRAGFEQDFEAVGSFAARTRSLELRALTAQSRAMLALLDGRFDEVEDLAGRVMTASGRDRTFLRGLFTQLAILRYEQGRIAELLPAALDVLAQNPDHVAIHSLVASFYAALGRQDEARRLFDPLIDADGARIPRSGLFTATLSGLTSTCALLCDVSAASTLHRLFAPYSGQLVVVGDAVGSWGAVDRFLGMLETLTGDLEAADARFAAAISIEESVGGIALAARTRYWYARMLADSERPPDRERARALLETSMATAEKVGMASVLSDGRVLAELIS